jgi:hypothetical protein
LSAIKTGYLSGIMETSAVQGLISGKRAAVGAGTLRRTFSRSGRPEDRVREFLRRGADAPSRRPVRAARLV